MEKKCLGVAENATEEERNVFLSKVGEVLMDAGEIVFAGVSNVLSGVPAFVAGMIGKTVEIARQKIKERKSEPAEMGA